MFKQKDFGDFAKGFEKMVDEVMSRSIGDLVGSDFAQSTPSANVKDNDNAFIIELASPGLNKTDFVIQVVEDQLEIKVEKKEKENEGIGQFTRREFNYKSFSRKFKIPKETDRSKISAEYENGILIISLPKFDDSLKNESHTIKVS